MTREKLTELIIDSTDTLYRVSKSILKNDTDCEDAVSEAIVISFNKIDTLLHDRYARTWLIRILIHECYRILNMKKCMDHGSEPEEYAAPEGEDYSELYRAIMKLDEKYRMPVVLYYLEGYKIREIARILDRSENTVKSQLARGRQMLKSELEKEVV